MDLGDVLRSRAFARGASYSGTREILLNPSACGFRVYGSVADAEHEHWVDLEIGRRSSAVERRMAD